MSIDDVGMEKVAIGGIVSVEEQVKQRIDECKRLDIHNHVCRLFSVVKELEGFGLINFGIDQIKIEGAAGKLQTVVIKKSDGSSYEFVKATTKIQKDSPFRGIDEIEVSFSVNGQNVFRSKWQNRYDMGQMYFDSKDYPEVILAYLPGIWSDDLLALIRKKSVMEEELRKMRLEKEKLKKQNDDKVNFGL